MAALTMMARSKRDSSAASRAAHKPRGGKKRGTPLGMTAAVAARSKRGSSTALRARERRGKSEGARNSAQNDGAMRAEKTKQRLPR